MAPSPVDRAARGLADLAAGIAAQIGRPPTLDELTEVLGWAAAPLAGGRPVVFTVRPRTKSSTDEVAELSDSTFADATELVTSLGTDLADLPGILLDGLRQAGPDVLTGTDPAAITAIDVTEPKTVKRAQAGDVIGIPVARGHVPAVVLTRNHWGIALGLFTSVASGPVTADRHPPVDPHPVYTGEQSIADGRWPVLGHDKKLLDLFPSEPEIYHRPVTDIPGFDFGPFGSAEKPNGEMRQLTEAEASEVGLLDGTYDQVLLPEVLEEHLAR